MTTRSHHGRGVHTIAPMGPRKLGQHKTYFTATLEGKHCPACGVIREDHPKCRACGVLVGYGHQEARLCDDGLCDTCKRQRDCHKVGAVLVAEAIAENVKWE